jgi:DNA modification methylase
MIVQGDCVALMAELAPGSVDAIVTDPPYGLGFMGREWDDLPPGIPWAKQCLRVLKPGGHLLAFGGTRTYHRLACAIEDAGFEIRDCLAWMYGSGFPKSLDVSKAIDKANGVAREPLERVQGAANDGVFIGDATTKDGGGDVRWNYKPEFDATAPATPEAQQWQGWGTALKPAHEPIVLARKPLAGTVAANVLEHGTGALNVDGTRIGPDPGYSYPNGAGGSTFSIGAGNDGTRTDPVESTAGRWPANVLLDEESAAGMPGEDGQSVSRYFYVAKASSAERNAGLEGFEEREAGNFEDDAYEWATDSRGNPRRAPIAKRNVHPTVKPIELMRWLVRLITPPGGVVLDPFTGSGTTGCAAALEGFDFIGFEREHEYVAIAEARIQWWSQHPDGLEIVKSIEAERERQKVRDSGQLGLEIA